MSEKKHYVYMVRCRDNSLYTGWTTDLEKRIHTHNYGEGLQAAKYTKSRRPVVLVYHEMFETKSEALKREWEIKQLSKAKKENLIANKNRTV